MKAIIIIGVLIAAFLVMGCTEVNSHENYAQTTIVQRFSQSYPISQLYFAMSPDLASMPSMYYYDYYIRYKIGNVPRVDRVSKDVYASVFEGNTYVLGWGFIDSPNSEHRDYGFTKVVSKVQP